MLRPSTLEGELKRFLIARTKRCAQDYIEAEFTGGQVDVTFGELEMDIRIRDHGISVDALYPVEQRTRGGSSFRLSTFDTFYSTKFKQLLDAAVAFPLQWDQKFVDFRYEGNTLLNPLFTFASRTDLGDCTPIGDDTPDDETDDYFDCSRSLQADKYSRLGLEMEKEETADGDDVFIFRAPFNDIILAEEFEFRVARQNRPPALDYIGRNECLLEEIPEEQRYDYLVIKGDEELGGIDVTVTARDADEDEWVGGNIDLIPIEDGTVEDLEKSSLFIERFVEGRGTQNPDNSFSLAIPKDDPSFDDFDNAIYTIKAFAQDIHDAQDWQLLRILIDRPLEVGLRIISPFRIRYEDHPLSLREYFGESQLWLSKEDPFALSVQLPEAAALDGDAVVTLQFTPTEETTPTWQGIVEIPYNQNAQNTFCFLFPGGVECRATLDLENEPESFLPLYSNQIDSLDPDSFLDPFTKNGNLEVAFSFPYCGVEEGNSDSINIISKNCVPHRDENYPFPYMRASGASSELRDYYSTFYTREALPGGSSGTYQLTGGQDSRRNPFQASNVCCNPDFEFFEGDKTCFISPQPGCFGQLKTSGRNPLPILTRGIILETLEVKCSEDRGNICDGEKSSTLYRGRMVCTGDPTTEEAREQAKYVNCDVNLVSEECMRKDAFSFQTDASGNRGICFNRNGGEREEDLGCRFFFGEENALVDNIPQPMPEHIFTGNARTPGTLNDMATSQFRDQGILNDILSRYHLGCNPPSDNNKWCDKNFDGYFEGVCDGNRCKSPLHCEPNKFYCDSETDYKAIKQCNNLRTEWITDGVSPCDPGYYCSGSAASRREDLCQEQACTPGGPLQCYFQLPGGTRQEFEEEILRDAPERYDEWRSLMDHLVFSCNERGSEYDDIVHLTEDEDDNPVGQCVNACEPDAEITLVDISTSSEPDAEPVWVCRTRCTRDDWDNERPCKTVGGGSGVCKENTGRSGPPFICD